MATPTPNGLRGAGITSAPGNSLIPQQSHAPLRKPNLQATPAPLCPIVIFMSARYHCCGRIAHLSFEKQ